MTADVELLPLPEEEWNVRYGYTADAVHDYARAVAEHNIKKRDAEIEVLRAEAAKRDGIDPWAVLLRAQAAEARAERLAEALRDLEVCANTADRCYSRMPGNFAVALQELRHSAERARAALRDHDKEDEK